MSNSAANPIAERKIIHIDMDCFFAAIEVRDNPHLKGKPVAVGGSPTGRGVVTTCTYEARKYGVRSAMPSAQALRLCRDLIFVKSHFDKYREASQQIHEVFREFTDKIEPLSLDEAYLDVTDCPDCNGSATLIAQEIRRRIFKRTELTASAGIAPNKFLAKVASDWKKPNGQFTLAPSDIPSFIVNLPVKKIPGVGKVTEKKMKDKGFQTCGDLQKKELHELTTLFGQWGAKLYDISRGIDRRTVGGRGGGRKSLSVERTYSKDMESQEQCLRQIEKLYKDFDERWQKIKEKYTIKGLFVKVKFSDFSTTTVDRSEFHFPGQSAFSTLLLEALDRSALSVRLIGVGVRLHPKNAPAQASNKKQMALF